MDKRQAVESLLKDGPVWVTFNPNEGADIPGHLDKRDLITFLYGYQLPYPIPDLFINNDGISATLKFGMRQLLTFVPWKAVVGVSDHQDKNYAWGWFEKKKPQLRLIKGGRK